jgi:hypothetical protein
MVEKKLLKKYSRYNVLYRRKTEFTLKVVMIGGLYLAGLIWSGWGIVN